MNWLDFTLALTSKLSGIGVILAILCTAICVVSGIVILISKEEYREVEMLSVFKTFGTLAMVMWVIASLPNSGNVKETQEEMKPTKIEKPIVDINKVSVHSKKGHKK